jgi:hypothetical protein
VVFAGAGVAFCEGAGVKLDVTALNVALLPPPPKKALIGLNRIFPRLALLPLVLDEVVSVENPAF